MGFNGAAASLRRNVERQQEASPGVVGLQRGRRIAAAE